MASLRGATVSFIDHSSAILDSKSQNSLLDSNQVTSRECRNGSLEQISRFSVFPQRPSRATLATTVMKGIDRSIGWHRPLKMASTVYDPEICSGDKLSHVGSFNTKNFFSEGQKNLVNSENKKNLSNHQLLKRKPSVCSTSLHLCKLITVLQFFFAHKHWFCNGFNNDIN